MVTVSYNPDSITILHPNISFNVSILSICVMMMRVYQAANVISLWAGKWVMNKQRPNGSNAYEKF